MDVCEPSPRHDPLAQHSGRDLMPAVPTEPDLGLATSLLHRQEPGLAEQEAQLEGRCQV